MATPFGKAGFSQASGVSQQGPDEQGAEQGRQTGKLPQENQDRHGNLLFIGFD